MLHAPSLRSSTSWTQGISKPILCLGRRLLNLAHVELNAVDLAWDTVARFSQAGLPQVVHPVLPI